MNQLFESDVLNGLDLSAHPILKDPEQEKIKNLKDQLSESTAKDKDWGQDISMLLRIAETQSKDFTNAESDVTNLLNKGDSLTLSDYLAGVKTLAVLPDGKYKQQLLDKLEPVKNQLSNENSSFAAQIQQSDASMAAAEKSYQERQAKALAERTKELNELKKIWLRSRRPMIPIKRSSIRSKIAKMMSLLGKIGVRVSFARVRFFSIL